MGSGNFKIYKSSAGSGKTYTIVKEYISLTLGFSLEDNIKHILAITFTNKAAAEMKERILKTLQQFSSGAPNGSSKIMFQEIRETKNISSIELQQRAQKTLDYILHHYSNFAVSTIDSFNHKIIRSFAFELKLPINFDLATDADEMLHLAVDRVLGKAGIENEVSLVLLNYIDEQLQDDKSWNIDKNLEKIGKQLFNEQIEENLKSIEHLTHTDFIEINKKINEFISQFRNKIESYGENALQLIDSNSIPLQDMAGGEKGVCKYFSYLKEFRTKNLSPTDTVIKAFDKQILYSTKAKAESKSVINKITPELSLLFQETQDFLANQLKKYLDFKTIRANLFLVAMLRELKKEIKALKEKNNILFISEFNKLIAASIANEPAPYIYEKIGERYQAFLIDEFQDTSILQWRNILPLIHNALSQGFFSMLVGDPKQSIYRWRNGAVEQFVKLPNLHAPEGMNPTLLEQEKSLKRSFEEKVLNTNYRSLPNIVQFNNLFFESVKKTSDFDFSSIYNEVEQNIVSNENKGSVHIALKDKAGADWILQRVKEVIDLCLEKGYAKKDIAILTRKNKQSSLVAQYLLNSGIDVISKESLLISSSFEVRCIIELLRFVENPANQISIAAIRYYFITQLNFQHNELCLKNNSNALISFFNLNSIKFNTEYLKSLPVFELCMELIILFRFNQKPNVYLKFFMDQVFNLNKKEQNIQFLIDWWEIKKVELSITVPEGIDAINLLTIHKSKGLQFPIVIIPFANINPTNAQEVKYWVNINNPAFPQLKSTLISHSDSLDKSSYSMAYSQEKEKIMMDIINMVYVAYTRPEEHLFIISDKAGKMIMLLDSFIESKKISFEATKIGETDFQSYGIIQNKALAPDHEKETGHLNMPIENTSWRKYLKTKKFKILSENEHEAFSFGNLIHQLLAEINSSTDVSEVLKKNRITIQQYGFDYKKIYEKIEEIMAIPELNQYFDGSYFLRKENTLLLTDGSTLRPDLVAIKNQKISIIDYKTGERHEHYAEQLKNYAKELEQMGYEIEKLLLVYTDQLNTQEILIN